MFYIRCDNVWEHCLYHRIFFFCKVMRNIFFLSQFFVLLLLAARTHDGTFLNLQTTLCVTALCKGSDQFSWGLCRARLPQCVNVSAYGDLPPDAGLGLLCESAPGMHHQHAIGRQAVHVTIRVLPLRSFFLKVKQKHRRWDGLLFFKKHIRKEAAFVYESTTYKLKGSNETKDERVNTDDEHLSWCTN